MLRIFLFDCHHISSATYGMERCPLGYNAAERVNTGYFIKWVDVLIFLLFIAGVSSVLSVLLADYW